MKEKIEAFVIKCDMSKSKLTWQDVQKIIQIANRRVNNLTYNEIKDLDEKGYYSAILNEFNAQQR